MERLAEADGDVNELVAINRRISLPVILNIAENWAKARLPDKALEWAERRMDAFQDRPDSHLRDSLVAACFKRKRNDEALQLTWIQFDERPSLGHQKSCTPLPTN